MQSHGSHDLVRGWAVTSHGQTVVVAKGVRRHELVREVLGSLLAKSLALPTPTPYVLDGETCGWPSVGNERLVFGTRAEAQGDLARRAMEAPETLDRLATWDSLPRAVAFDTWIANADRRPANLLYGSRGEFLVIDHGEALPSGMRAGSPSRNGLARHMIASQAHQPPRELARRVRAACSDFGSVDFDQLEVASLDSLSGAQVYT